MKTTFVALALAAFAMAKPMPELTSRESCSDSHSGTFEITIVNATSSAKRGLERRQLDGTLKLTLTDGVLKDQAGRTGYIASNYQWQFDNPPQVNAISASGYSYCPNNTLALDGSAIFYSCKSGDFSNLYDRKWATYCLPIYLEAISTGSSPAASQASDGQPQASTAVITQISDGQPQATTAVLISQLSDGQPQAPTSVALVTQLSDGQPQAPTSVALVTQISDGQPQAPTSVALVTQLSDGQPQAPTSVALITQISDGQPQAPTVIPVTEISDGQPQAPAITSAAVVSQISDGQPQVPATSAPYPIITSGVPVSQLSDGQPQATGTGNYTIQTSVPAEFTGAAATAAYGVGAFAAGLMGVVAML